MTRVHCLCWAVIIHWQLFNSCVKVEGQESLSSPLTDVFVAGQDGYASYRIPAIVKTQESTLLAFCEGRKAGRGDAGNIDLVVRRSPDGGLSWEAMQIIWDDGLNTCGNPCPVVDQATGRIWLLMTWNRGDDSEGEIMQGTSNDVRRIFVTHSDDDGRSWEAPKQISDSARRDHWRWYATGPGNAIQLERGDHAGRLIIPANHSDHSDPRKHPYRSHVFWSDDHGETWQLGGVHQDRTNESAVVELEDGALLQSMRSYHGTGRRAQAFSEDGGRTWSEVELMEQLVTPVCQASAIRFRWATDADTGLLLFSSPQGTDRSRLTLWLSTDDGRSWPVSHLVYEGSAAYSNLVKLSPEDVGVLFERDDYRKISFQVFNVTELLPE